MNSDAPRCSSFSPGDRACWQGVGRCLSNTGAVKAHFYNIWLMRNRRLINTLHVISFAHMWAYYVPNVFMNYNSGGKDRLKLQFW